MYLNPVYPHDFPDPFVLKYCGEYWAYGTGFWRDGRVFGILRSRDLVKWDEVGGAMAPLPVDYTCYWAPEVSYENGRFLMYYSVGDGNCMHIRLATAGHPAGPFVDSGHRLTPDPFAIDPHLFVDDDGSRHLFYAVDFLDHSHIGTGTVRDRLLDPVTLAGHPQPITRAGYDWQVYDPQRLEKGGVRWHTIEGSFVLKRKGIYYQMFSGGNWQNPSYGVSYATTSNLSQEEEWQQQCDGETVLPILRSVPGQVTGPGHNSVIRGPDNRQLYCVYHRWGHDGRYMAIDPLDWAGTRLFINGPTNSPQPRPAPATFADFFDGPALDDHWRPDSDNWALEGDAVVCRSLDGECHLRYDLPAPAFLAEVSLRARPPGTGTIGVDLHATAGIVLRFRLLPADLQALVVWQDGLTWHYETFLLPADFDAASYHLLRLEVDGHQASLSLDEGSGQGSWPLPAPVITLSLCVDQSAAAFAGFAVTVGWEDLFTQSEWSRSQWRGDETSGWQWQDGELHFSAPGESGRLRRGPRLAAYEMAVNARLAATDDQYGFLPALGDAGQGPLLVVTRNGHEWVLSWQEGDENVQFPLPPAFDATQYQQFRFRKADGRLSVFWEGERLATGVVPAEPTEVGLYAAGIGVTFEMVRVTAIDTTGGQKQDEPVPILLGGGH